MTKLLLTIIGTLTGLVLIILGAADFVNTTFRPYVIGGGVGLIGSIVGSYIFSFATSRNGDRDEPTTAHENIDKTTVRIINSFSQLNLQTIVTNTKHRLLFFTVSGRNILSSTQMVTAFRDLIFNNSGLKVQFLCLNQYADNDFPTQRRKMMDTAGRYNAYDADFFRARESARQITNLDPAHNIVDFRFYDLLPTTFFVISDDKLYVSFLLSKPVAECPTIEVDGNTHNKVFHDFLNHFNFYWNESRSFVSVVGLLPDGRFVMVKNRKRGWEWPAGYLEPDEHPETSAAREFLEETGYSISKLRLLQQTPSGMFYYGEVGELIGEPSAREVGDVAFFQDLPVRGDLSFEEERGLFEVILRSCR